jgi:hypothetical protein
MLSENFVISADYFETTLNRNKRWNKLLSLSKRKGKKGCQWMNE